eukprot:TRINITY_DN2422_c0_g1_i9.p1 TRINITY_DN2422_c0_g1~~TRINITY_DN2422_c0_g1_i9.p1  ORF type:complete len:507 (-),score=44.85 TRINITY_DN2422_c0_g1_i9:129-1649(-)
MEPSESADAYPSIASLDIVQNTRSVGIDNEATMGKSKLSLWTEFVCIVVSYSVVGSAVSLLGSASPYIIQTYNVSTDQLGILFLIYAFSLAFGNVGNALIYYYAKYHHSQKPSTVHPNLINSEPETIERPPILDSNKKLLFVGLICCLGSLVFLWRIPAEYGFYAFFVGHIFFGFFASFIEGAVNSIVSEYDSKIVASAFNLLHVGFGIGAVSCPYIFQYFAGNFNLGTGYGILALITCFAILLCFAIMVLGSLYKRGSIPEHDFDRSIREPFPLLRESSVFQILKEDFKVLITKQMFWIILVVILCYIGNETVVSGWIKLLITEIGYDKWGSLCDTLFWGGVLIGRVIFPLWASSLTQTIYGSLKVLLGTSFLAILILAGFLLVDTVCKPYVPFFTILLFPLLIGLFNAGIFPLIIHITTTLFSSQSGNTMAATTYILVFTNVGSGLFPLVVGIIANLASVLKGMWIGVASAVGMVLVEYLFYVKYNRVNDNLLHGNSPPTYMTM